MVNYTTHLAKVLHKNMQPFCFSYATIIQRLPTPKLTSTQILWSVKCLSYFLFTWL